ncbi:MAG: CoA transferase [Candidatus Sericytochromatia bacterium]|nr:CoA transferase [Candidatus Sericytochromatia bacterium]
MRVIECASVLAGPAVGAFFAELGATVIKIEPLNGDVTRSWRLSTESPQDSVSAYFSCVNWGKHSLALDLKQPAGQELAHQLVQQADILIANYKPGAAERLKMDYTTLSALNPRLIYAHLTGYGAADSRTGYDALIQAESGFLHLNAHPGQPPVRLPVALMDLLAAHQLKEAILVALLQRVGSGQGDYLKVSLLASALASLANQASNWLVGGVDPAPLGLEHPNIVPYGTLYATADGSEIMLAIGSDAQFKALCQILGRPELAAQPHFSSNALRVQHREALHQQLRPLMAACQARSLLPKLWQADIPAGQVQSVAQALAQDHPAVNALRLQSPDGRLKGLRTCAFESRHHLPQALLPPPALGADSAFVLETFLHWRPEQVAAAAQAGLILAPES